MTLMQWNTLGAVLGLRVGLTLIAVGILIQHFAKDKHSVFTTVASLSAIGALTTWIFLVVLGGMWSQIGQAWFGVQK